MGLVPLYGPGQAVCRRLLSRPGAHLAEAELLQAQYPDILPGFYTDKRNWIACFLDGSLPDKVLRDLCAGSHRLILEKLPKYVQRELLRT